MADVRLAWMSWKRAKDTHWEVLQCDYLGDLEEDDENEQKHKVSTPHVSRIEGVARREIVSSGDDVATAFRSEQRAGLERTEDIPAELKSDCVVKAREFGIRTGTWSDRGHSWALRNFRRR